MSCSRASLVGLCGAALVGTLFVLDSRGLVTPAAPEKSLRGGGRRLQENVGQVGDQLAGAAQEHASNLGDKAWEHGSNLGNKAWEHGGNLAGHAADKAWEHGGNLGNKAMEHGGNLANKAYEHGSNVAGDAWDAAPDRHEVYGHAKNLGNKAYEHGAHWGGKAYEHGSAAAGDVWDRRHEIAGDAYDHGKHWGGKAYEHGKHWGGKAYEHGSALGHHIAQNPGTYGNHLANHGWILSNGALWPLAFLDGFPTAWKAAIVCLQAIFAIIYYIVVVSNYPFWMAPTPLSSQMQREFAPVATTQTSPANCCLSFLCPQARAAHTFDRTGTIEYFCGLLGMFLCPFCTLCYANSCMDLNPKLGGEPANPVMSALCTWCCSCCVIAQDAESLDAATGARTELCGVTESMPQHGFGGSMSPMGGPGMGMYPPQMMMSGPPPYARQSYY